MLYYFSIIMCFPYSQSIVMYFFPSIECRFREKCVASSRWTDSAYLKLRREHIPQNISRTGIGQDGGICLCVPSLL